MGKAKRTGLDGTAITAISVGVGLLTNGDVYSAAVAFAIGIIALVLSDKVKMEEFGVSEETVRNASEQVGDVVEDTAENAR